MSTQASCMHYMTIGLSFFLGILPIHIASASSYIVEITSYNFEKPSRDKYIFGGKEQAYSDSFDYRAALICVATGTALILITHKLSKQRNSDKTEEPPVEEEVQSANGPDLHKEPLIEEGVQSASGTTQLEELSFIDLAIHTGKVDFEAEDLLDSISTDSGNAPARIQNENQDIPAHSQEIQLPIEKSHNKGFDKFFRTLLFISCCIDRFARASDQLVRLFIFVENFSIKNNAMGTPLTILSANAIVIGTFLSALYPIYLASATIADVAGSSFSYLTSNTNLLLNRLTITEKNAPIQLPEALKHALLKAVKIVSLSSILVTCTLIGVSQHRSATGLVITISHERE